MLIILISIILYFTQGAGLDSEGIWVGFEGGSVGGSMVEWSDRGAIKRIWWL